MSDDQMRDLFARLVRIRFEDGFDPDKYALCDLISRCADVPYTKVVSVCVFEEEE